MEHIVFFARDQGEGDDSSDHRLFICRVVIKIIKGGLLVLKFTVLIRSLLLQVQCKFVIR